MQDYRREVDQKLQLQGLELKERQMYSDMVFKTLGMGESVSDLDLDYYKKQTEKWKQRNNIK